MGEYNAYGQGVRATFIRLSGCNLKCSYCDTAVTQSGDTGDFYTIPEIIEAVDKLGNQVVCITGGEPLLQEYCKDLIIDLHDSEYSVVLETNGTMRIASIEKYCNVILDYKFEYPVRMHHANWNQLSSDDAIKFVISSEKDFQEACDVIRKVKTDPVFVFSPNLSVISAKEIFNFIQKKQFDRDVNVLLSVQIHKLIDVQ